MNIDGSNIGQAIDLLVEGFPERERGFWERVLDQNGEEARSPGLAYRSDGLPRPALRLQAASRDG